MLLVELPVRLVTVCEWPYLLNLGFSPEISILVTNIDIYDDVNIISSRKRIKYKIVPRFTFTLGQTWQSWWN
jgi:hypothetical protein